MFELKGVLERYNSKSIDQITEKNMILESEELVKKDGAKVKYYNSSYQRKIRAQNKKQAIAE